MMLSRVLLALTFAVVFMLPIAPAQGADAAATGKAEKVVWHVDFGDPRRLSAMIQSVNNMVTAYQDELTDYDVRIVFVGAGIRFLTHASLTGTPFAEDAELKARRAELIQRLEQLRDVQQVKLELCDITRESVNLPKDDVIRGVQAVRSGVVRIAALQHRGYAYLKQE